MADEAGFKVKKKSKTSPFYNDSMRPPPPILVWEMSMVFAGTNNANCGRDE